MLKILLAIISVPLVIVHLIILYLWMGEREKLVTEIGLISWVGSIILGIIIYCSYRKLNHSEKNFLVTKRIIFSSTLLTIFLGVFAIIIEFITNSMP